LIPGSFYLGDKDDISISGLLQFRFEGL